jgi:hypothetical protein
MLDTRSFQAMAAGAALALSAAAAPAHDYWDPQVGKAIQVYTQGGTYSPLADLDDAGHTDFRTGFSLGGGAAPFSARAESPSSATSSA